MNPTIWVIYPLILQLLFMYMNHKTLELQASRSVHLARQMGLGKRRNRGCRRANIKKRHLELCNAAQLRVVIRVSGLGFRVY